MCLTKLGGRIEDTSNLRYFISVGMRLTCAHFVALSRTLNLVSSNLVGGDGNAPRGNFLTYYANSFTDCRKGHHPLFFTIVQRTARIRT